MVVSKRTIAAMATLAMLGAGPARAAYYNGYQFVVDFEEVDPGTTNLDYDMSDTHVTGGTVSDDSSFTAHSGANVYVGASISTQQWVVPYAFNGVDYWPAIGAYVSPGDSAVLATFYGYDPDADALEALGTATTSGSAANQYLSFTSLSGAAPWLVSVTFTSDSDFAIDDLSFGLPDAPAGIPEPSAWAMILAGVFGLGSLLRRGRSARVRAGA